MSEIITDVRCQVRFVGACLDHSQPFLVTEYCPRGSLQVCCDKNKAFIHRAPFIAGYFGGRHEPRLEL